MNHGVYVSEQATSVGTPNVANSGIPFVVGLAPVHAAENPAVVGTPVLCTSWNEAVAQLGYSDDWKTYTLCEFMHSHFRLYNSQPVILLNVLDPSSMNETKAEESVTVEDHKARLPFEAIVDDTLSVTGGESPLTKDKDYSVYYDKDALVIELLSGSEQYSAGSLTVTYKKVKAESVENQNIADGIEKIELCLTKLGVTPDLICVPGFSHIPEIAAAMAVKAGGINGMHTAKALIDLDASPSGVKTYSTAAEKKNESGLTDPDQIVCWPMGKNGAHIYHMSTHIAGLMAQVDTGNEGCPYESPSNKNLAIDGICLEDGTEVDLTLTQANMLNANGIVTALNFVSGWVAWGNYTACYPTNNDPKDCFIPVGRMFDWVRNTLIRTFWSRLDKPMTRRLVDTVLDAANIWFNSLKGSGYIYGGRVEMLESENTVTNLMAGIIKLHVYIAPISPTQEIDFTLEYDASYVSAALQA